MISSSLPIFSPMSQLRSIFISKLCSLLGPRQRKRNHFSSTFLSRPLLSERYLFCAFVCNRCCSKLYSTFVRHTLGKQWQISADNCSNFKISACGWTVGHHYGVYKNLSTFR